MTVADLLARARATLDRVEPHEAAAALADGAPDVVLIDIRSDRGFQAWRAAGLPVAPQLGSSPSW